MRTPCTTPRSRWRLSDFMTDTEHPRAIRSFVTRAGRILTEACQERALEVLWPKHGLELTRLSPLDWARRCSSTEGACEASKSKAGQRREPGHKMAGSAPRSATISASRCTARASAGYCWRSKKPGRPMGQATHQCPRHLPRRRRGVARADRPTVARMRSSSSSPGPRGRRRGIAKRCLVQGAFIELVSRSRLRPRESCAWPPTGSLTRKKCSPF